MFSFLYMLNYVYEFHSLSKANLRVTMSRQSLRGTTPWSLSCSRMLGPDMPGLHESCVHSLLACLLDILWLWWYRALISLSKPTRGWAHRVTSYMSYIGLGGWRLEVEILGRCWKMPPRKLMCVGSCLIPFKYFRNVDVAPFVHNWFARAWSSSPTMNRSPFTFPNICMWSSCCIWGHITPSQD